MGNLDVFAHVPQFEGSSNTMAAVRNESNWNTAHFGLVDPLICSISKNWQSTSIDELF